MDILAILALCASAVACVLAVCCIGMVGALEADVLSLVRWQRIEADRELSKLAPPNDRNNADPHRGNSPNGTISPTTRLKLLKPL